MLSHGFSETIRIKGSKMKYIKAKDLKVKMVFVKDGKTLVAFKVLDYTDVIEVETIAVGNELILLRPNEPILVLGELANE